MQAAVQGDYALGQVQFSWRHSASGDWQVLPTIPAGNSVWRATLPNSLAEADYDLRITATDTSGNELVFTCTPGWRVGSFVSVNVLRVKCAASGPQHDGLSWDTEFQTVQAALDAAIPGHEIWVARGAYAPSLPTDPGNPRTATFRLCSGIAL